MRHRARYLLGVALVLAFIAQAQAQNLTKSLCGSVTVTVGDTAMPATAMASRVGIYIKNSHATSTLYCSTQGVGDGGDEADGFDIGPTSERYFAANSSTIIKCVASTGSITAYVREVR